MPLKSQVLSALCRICVSVIQRCWLICQTGTCVTALLWHNMSFGTYKSLFLGSLVQKVIGPSGPFDTYCTGLEADKWRSHRSDMELLWHNVAI